MGVKEIVITRRLTAIVEESYTLEVDEDVYNKYREENPGKSIPEVLEVVASDRVDYEVEIQDICEIHNVDYEEIN